MVVAANEGVNEQAQTPAEDAQAQTEDNAAESEKKADESDTMNTPVMQEDEEAKKPSQPPGAHPGNEN